MPPAKSGSISRARSAALEILRRVEAEGAYSSLALRAVFDRQTGMPPADRALATDLVYGTLRWRRRIDHALTLHCRRPLHKVEPTLLRILRLGTYQLLFLDRVPPWAAVDQSAALARIIRGARAAGFVNGVLRALAAGRRAIRWPDPARDPVAALGVEHSFPDWLVARWLERFGPERTAALLGACNRPAALWVRVHTLRTDAAELGRLLEASGTRSRPCPWLPQALRLEDPGRVDALAAHQAGLFHVQDAAAQAVCHLVAPRPGERILDACAAPGGKSATLAQMMRDRGAIVAGDIHPARVGLIEQLTARLGLGCVQTRCGDAAAPAPAGQRAFDRVLVDAPCSALGVIRRHPECKWRVQPEDLVRLAGLQRKLLDAAVAALAPGGTLVYSVCTPTAEEGPALLETWLQDHPGMIPQDPRRDAPASWHRLLDPRGRLATWPDLHEMDAHFAVRLLKRE